MACGSGSNSSSAPTGTGGNNPGGGSSSVAGTSGGTPNSAGATFQGGSAATGAVANSGGVTHVGGSATGGIVSSTGGTGGIAATGGATTQGSGGAAPGGTSGQGGTKSVGGSATGGTAAKGGAANTGGTTAAKATSTGGLTPGGASATGGKATGGSTTSSTGGASTAGSSSTGACVASSVVANMKLGWNLGNSLDCVDSSKTDTTVETAWGNPVVTSDLIQAVAAAGFGAVRIPVSWINHFGSAPNYTISATYINRVEAVVQYVLDQGLYAIINIHHDGGNNVTGRWLTLVDSSGQVTTDHTNAVLTEFKALWSQIGDHFKAYDNHLIFESMNEVMVDYNTPLQSYYDEINGLNQAFVDTVRASTGNNPNRCLVVPGYNTNIDYTVAGFVAPKDNAAGKLILSDHFYDPYTFTGSATTHTWGTGNPGIDNWGQEDWVQSEVAKLKSTFIDPGLPMIWGEYGAVNQSGYENYRRYYIEYVTKAVHDAGITPFFWDNGATGSGSDAFGLIDRSANTVLYPTILQAMTRAITSNYTLADVQKP